MILSVLFVPRISCFTSKFLLKLILVHVPFALLLLPFGIHYLILSGLLLLDLPLDELSKLTTTRPSNSCMHLHLRFYFRHWRITNLHFVQKIWLNLRAWFLRYVRGQTDRQTDTLLQYTAHLLVAK